MTQEPTHGLIERLGNGNPKITGGYRLLVMTISGLATALMSVLVWLGLQVWSNTQTAHDTNAANTVTLAWHSYELDQITAQLQGQSKKLQELSDRLSIIEGRDEFGNHVHRNQ